MRVRMDSELDRHTDVGKVLKKPKPRSKTSVVVVMGDVVNSGSEVQVTARQLNHLHNAGDGFC